jgi:gamma-glutamyltranspeptidase/glutathione hydrolase
VVDREGDVAVITHTINAVIWGDTGIVVDGIPIPDSAAFQQERLAKLKPGDRVPHEIIDTISFKGRQPVLATGSIGSSLVPESLRVLVGVLGQRQTLPEVMAQPPLLANFSFSADERPLAERPVSVEESAYSKDYIAKLKAAGINLTDVPQATAAGLRGTLAAVQINTATKLRSTADQPGVMVFNEAQ